MSLIHFPMKFLRTKKKGFSMGEVILSSFVLTIGLVSIAMLTATSYRQSLESRDMIIATGLAQEGVELVRNVRDNNLAAGGTGFVGFSNSNKHCRVDYNDAFAYPNATTVNPLLNCTAASGAVSRYTLQYDGRYYIHADTGAERFSRHIYVNYNTADNTVLVRSFAYVTAAYTPPANGLADGCTAASKCAYTEVVLTDWK
jgi:Tfp pilus assembly protein PilV